MTPQAMIKWMGTVDPAAAEQAWLGLLDSENLSPKELAGYDCVLSELVRRDQTSLAESLAWAAIESASERHSPADALHVARAFLLALGESTEVRTQAAELYRQVHADRPEIESLLREAGLGGGRPVRRAVRTLDVCLPLSEGDYLVSREGAAAARVERIDVSTWTYEITASNGRMSLPAVRLADEFRPASPDELIVMRRYAPRDLAARLWDDPAGIIVDLCRQRDNQVSSDTLEALLVPDVLSEEEWKKWWTRARTAFRRSPWLDVGPRKAGQPVTIRLLDRPVGPEDALRAAFDGLASPAAAVEAVERYLRECKACNEKPTTEVLQECHNLVTERARKSTQSSRADAAGWWAAQCHLSQITGIAEGSDGAREFFKHLNDPAAAFAGIEHESLLKSACNVLFEARPDDARDFLLTLLPRMPASVCEHIAARLTEKCSSQALPDFEPIVQTILAEPVEHFDALLWLWNGPAVENFPQPPPVTILSCVLRVLEKCRVGEGPSNETSRRITAHARSALSARKYERFRQCLEEMDPPMGRALQRQIDRLDNLSRITRSDLINMLRRRFPPTEPPRNVPPWEREDVIYVTEAGLRQKQREIEHHVNVKMRENAVAIGRAAEHGDLSENSEYKFALEERDLLRARLAQMNAELAIAQVISPAEVPTDHAGIGSRVVFERESDGARYEIGIVGPWEADAEAGRYNYKAPLCRRILGKRVGDVLEFDHTAATGNYRIVALENALAPER